MFYLAEVIHPLDEKSNPPSVSTQSNEDNVFQIDHIAKIVVPKRLDVIVPSQKHGELSEESRQPLLFPVEGKAKQLI